jgi:hypothetical protein
LETASKETDLWMVTPSGFLSIDHQHRRVLNTTNA